MKRTTKATRALVGLFMLASCNSILGIEERDLVDGVAGQVQAGASSAGESGDANGGAAGSMMSFGGSETGGSEVGGAGGSPDQPEGGTASGAGGVSSDGGAGGSASGNGGSASGNGGSVSGNGGSASGNGGGGAGAGGSAGSNSQAGSGGTGGGNNACNANIVAESSGAQHTHTLTVTVADIVAGVTKTYPTSITSGHNHYVQVTAANFTALKAGMEVKRKSCSGGDHQFVLKCGGGGSTPTPPTAQECQDECGATDLTACP